MKNPILKAILVALTGLLVGGTGLAQRQMENLNRGVVAVKKSSTQIYVSWRLFGNDPIAVAFNLYRSANGAAATKLAEYALAGQPYDFTARSFFRFRFEK